MNIKTALITSLIKLGLEKGISQKVRPKLLGIKLLAFFLIFLGILFLFFALHQLLTIYYGQIIANSFFGGVFILLAVIILVVIHRKESKKNLSSDPIADLQQMAQPLLDSAQQVKEKTQATITRHQGKIILGTLLVGALLGRLKAQQSQHQREN